MRGLGQARNEGSDGKTDFLERRRVNDLLGLKRSESSKLQTEAGAYWFTSSISLRLKLLCESRQVGMLVQEPK